MITTVNLPDETWKKFKGIVYGEGKQVKTVLLELIEEFIHNYNATRGNNA